MRIELVRFDLTWLKLNWFDLTWFDLILFDLNWIELIGKHLRDIWEASGRHQGSKGAPRRHPGGTQETPRRHPGGTQEAARRHPGAPRAPGSLQEVLGAKRSTPLSLNAKKWKIWAFHEVFLKVGVTKYRAWRQNLSDTLRRGNSISPRALYQNRQNPYRWNLFGEKLTLLTKMSYKWSGAIIKVIL